MVCRPIFFSETCLGLEEKIFLFYFILNPNMYESVKEFSQTTDQCNPMIIRRVIFCTRFINSKYHSMNLVLRVVQD